MMDRLLTAGVVLFSGFAGLAWLRSATVKVRVQQGGDVLLVEESPGGFRMVVDGVDLLPTAALQSRWNARAAAFACVAALFQTVQAANSWFW